jgi:hypothetical protein
MIVVSEVRCSDCLAEFGDGPKFGVIKEDKSQSYNEEARMLGAHLFQVLVCGDCAGWYSDPIAANDAAEEMFRA